jgi:hypothetical protein
MLSIAHMATGAFVASALPSPVLYIPVTLAAHYLEDWIPHWDVGTGLSNGKRSKKAAFLLELADLALAFLLVFWWWQYGNSEFQWHIWVGAVTAIVPDLIEAPTNFLKWEPAWLKPINDFHGWLHCSTPQVVLGLLPQILVIAMIALVK